MRNLDSRGLVDRIFEPPASETRAEVRPGSAGIHVYVNTKSQDVDETPWVEESTDSPIKFYVAVQRRKAGYAFIQYHDTDKVIFDALHRQICESFEVFR